MMTTERGAVETTLSQDTKSDPERPADLVLDGSPDAVRPNDAGKGGLPVPLPRSALAKRQIDAGPEWLSCSP